MRNHWWWRPGWHVGRSFYTWHLTVGDDPEVRQLAADYAELLGKLPMLDPVPTRWLHLTTQGVGFTDEVDQADLERIITATRARCAGLAPITVMLGPARFDPEGFYLPVTPLDPLVELRDALRDAIGDVWGSENVPESAAGFRPHVTLGYSNSAGPAEPISEAFSGYPQHAALTTITTVSLINLNRDDQEYRWSDVAGVEFGR
jgi:2'-5' RNA ligase